MNNEDVRKFAIHSLTQIIDNFSDPEHWTRSEYRDGEEDRFCAIGHVVNVVGKDRWYYMTNRTWTYNNTPQIQLIHDLCDLSANQWVKEDDRQYIRDCINGRDYSEYLSANPDMIGKYSMIDINDSDGQAEALEVFKYAVENLIAADNVEFEMILTRYCDTMETIMEVQ